MTDLTEIPTARPAPAPTRKPTPGRTPAPRRHTTHSPAPPSVRTQINSPRLPSSGFTRIHHRKALFVFLVNVPESVRLAGTVRLAHPTLTLACTLVPAQFGLIVPVGYTVDFVGFRVGGIGDATLLMDSWRYRDEVRGGKAYSLN